MFKKKIKPSLTPEQIEEKRRKRFLYTTFPLIVFVPTMSYLFVSAAAFITILESKDLLLKDDFAKLLTASFAIFATLTSISFSWRRSTADTTTKEYYAVSQAGYHFFGTALFLLFATIMFYTVRYFSLSDNNMPIIFFILMLFSMLQLLLAWSFSFVGFFHCLFALYFKIFKMPGASKPPREMLKPEHTDLL
jgi:hypothetical protein